MVSLSSFNLSANGLFDFDLTFFLQALIFLIFSLIVTNFFLLPISDIIAKRTEIVALNNQKAAILLSLIAEKIFFCLNFNKNQKKEYLRQIKKFEIALDGYIGAQENAFQSKIETLLSLADKSFLYSSIALVSKLSNSIEKTLEKKINI